MATQTIEFAAPSGQTITAKLFDAGSDTIEATASSVTARTNAAGVYVATVTSTLSGVYRLVATNPAGTLLAQWWVRLANADGTYIAYESPNADYLDATVSSRLATSGYTTPPTAATNATAVRTELATELGRIDVAVSTRSTFAGGAVASVTAGVTVTTNNDKTGYALTAVTGLGNQTANITGNVSGSVGSVTGAVGSVTGAVGSVTNRVTANTDQWNGVTVTGMPMPTYVQPTGFLAATFPATVSSFAGGAVSSVTGNVGGNVVGSVGSISGVTFPANFATLGINASGHVSRVVLVDTTTTNSDMRGTDNALLASGYTVPPTAAANATAVRTELATELGRVDVAVSTRSTFAGGAVASVTGNVGGNVVGSVGSVTGAVGSVTAQVTANVNEWGGAAVTGMPMPTYVQPTGFLATTFPATVSSFAGGAVASVSGSVGSVTGNVGGNVVGSVGSISGVTFPANFAALGINASGHVSRVVLVDTTTTNSDMRGTDNALLASGYTEPPTAAVNATAVRTELATELDRIDVAVSTRSTFAGGAVASVTAGVTVTTNNDKTGYALTAVTGLGNQTANITGNVSGSVGSISGVTFPTNFAALGINASGHVSRVVLVDTTTTNEDKTGYSLQAATGLGNQTANITGNIIGSVASVTGSVGSVTGNVGGNVVGSVGSISGVTFPANFAALGINASGHVSRVVLVDTTTVNSDMRGTDNALLAASYTAPLTTAGTAAAVWNALLATYTTAGSFGARVVRSTNSNNELQLTGSHHAAAVLHDAEPDSIPADALTAATITAIQAGLATAANQTTIIQYIDTEIAAIKLVTDKINTGLVQDGAVYQFTVNMLENGPAGAGGGSATLGNQETIIQHLEGIKGAGWDSSDALTAISSLVAAGIGSALASLGFTTGTIAGFPTTLRVGDSYTLAVNRAIAVYVRDAQGTPITQVGSKLFSDAQFKPACVITQDGQSGRVDATVTWVPPVGQAEGYLRIEIPSSRSALARAGVASVQVTLQWPGVVFTLATQAVTWLPKV